MSKDRISQELLDASRDMERKLSSIADAYRAAEDARWMFARAHSLITRQINAAVVLPGAFREPNTLLRFNMSFASAFVDAVKYKGGRHWHQAFLQCKTGEVFSSAMDAKDPYASATPAGFKQPNGDAIVACAVAMADAHINTDIVFSLRSVGCIDPNDYGNILYFVERAARETIVELVGNELVGDVVNWLKKALLPLDEVWRNGAYLGVCGVDTPPVEEEFIFTVNRKLAQARP
jgi:hypothetical protein